MSLSAEALDKLEGLDLQGVRAGLDFVPTGESRRPVLADLTADGMREFRNWDLSGVLAGLNSLTFEAVHPELVLPPAPLPEPEPAPDETVAPIPDSEGGLPDWLKPAEEAAPEVVAEPPAELPEPSPRDQWNQLADDQRNADLGEWYKKLQAGEPIEDWQRQALKDFNIWAGNSPPSPAEAEEPAAAAEPEGKEAEEELAEAAAGSLAGAGGKMRSFFESRKGQMTLKGVEFAAGGVVGVAIAEISKLDPAWEAGIVIMAQSALGLSRLGTELGAQAIEVAEKKFPRFAGLSAKLAGEKGLSGVLRSIKNLATRIQYRPFLMGLSVGIIGHSAFETITGHSIFPDVNAAETGGIEAGAEPTATVEPTGTAEPAATGLPEGGEAGAAGGQIDEYPGVDEGETPGQTAEEVRQAAEAAEAQAAEAAEAALEALNSGKTIGELAESSGQLPWNVVRESVGSGLHAGEVTNVVTRALQAGGVDISNLHEGAISQLVTKVQGLFDSADNALKTFNAGHPYVPRPYDAGGLGAVETMKGLNSPEVQAIRAANLADMEAAGNLFNNLLNSVLNP